MRKLVLSLIVFVLAAMPALAGEKMGYTRPQPSAEFDRVGGLAGKWGGTIKHSNGNEEPAVVEYKVTSGGTAVVETLSPGTSHEMVSVYHDKGGKLMMTHYCMIGNQPQMELKSADAGHLKFESSAQTNQELAGQMYMNSLTLEEPSKDKLVQTWTALGPDGKPADSTVFSLKRAA